MKTEDFLGVNGEPVYIDGTTHNNLLSARKNAKQYNGDLVIVVDGEEGSGKSTLARQIAKFLDPDFTEDSILYSSEECIQAHYKGEHWQSLVLDESKEDLDRKSTMSRKNKRFMNFLSQSRILHKFLIVVLPSVYDLDKYVAEHRAKMLFHCYKHRGRTPGYYTFFGKRGIKKLFMFGQKYRSYPVKASFTARFTKAEVVDLERYNSMKLAAAKKFNSDNNEPILSYQEIRREFIKANLSKKDELKEKWGLTNEALAECWDVSSVSLWRIEQDVNDSPKQ